MYVNQYQAAVLSLLNDSPISSKEVIRDVRESVQAGEIELAFDTIVSWIYEDSLSISPAYYARLAGIAEAMGSERAVERLREQVRDDL